MIGISSVRVEVTCLLVGALLNDVVGLLVVDNNKASDTVLMFAF